ncbi:A/G-specific adenine glycosylase [Kwoniella dejecticola CBS 10117]|uniref:Adenine DNA glycosylase n=1 Tax=Kwoniella dejecticola CBS 10117 TaxID=1296121 RepID=A0AAJ8MH87_9TREE
MRAESSRSASIISVKDSDGSDYQPVRENDSPPKRTSVKRKRAPVGKKLPAESKIRSKIANEVEDIEDSTGPFILRDHGMEYHSVAEIVERQEDLLSWFETCREKRGMPWRKRYDPRLSMEEKGQRAYEIWVSEVMLQQTQVATVIAYWRRWIEKWPTIADLAKADVEEVNAMWRGLGYYRRARSLLAGAKTVMSKAKYKGRLPDDPLILEKEIDGVGRYTAGAICSMAYGISTPIVDGNIHRLFTRLLAVHAPQTAPSTIKFLWGAAEQLVEKLPFDQNRQGITGDWNQALMELGSQVCKPVSPDCSACPLQSSCKAYAELSASPPQPLELPCALCSPVPSSTTVERISSISIFPMRKEKKASRAEEESVLLTEWKGGDGDRKWLFVKRPEKGLLAGLYEPPTTPVESSSTPKTCLETSISALSEIIDFSPAELLKQGQSRYISSIPHIFSHINMTYHIHHSTISDSSAVPPPLRETDRTVVWLSEDEVVHANIGTGVKKVWAEVYGSWGSFDEESPKVKKPKNGTTQARQKKSPLEEVKNGKIVKKIMMPSMPTRKVKSDEVHEE